MKFALPFALCLAFATTACNTIENRRSEYRPKKGDGPATRSLHDGSWQHQKSVDQQYAEAKRQKAKTSGASTSAPAPTSQQ